MLGPMRSRKLDRKLARTATLALGLLGPALRAPVAAPEAPKPSFTLPLRASFLAPSPALLITELLCGLDFRSLS